MQDSTNATHIVGIGSSAGGLEALVRLLSGMGAEVPAALVMIPHLSADHPSMLAEIVSRKVGIDITTVEQGMIPEAGRLYMIPPGSNLKVEDGAFALSALSGSSGLNLPIDVFFRSMAKSHGERAIGVILSGTGSDGSRGIRSIKEAGGLVLVQDQKSASFDGMPYHAIHTGLADFVGSPEEIQSFLGRLFEIQDTTGDELTRLLLEPNVLGRITEAVLAKTRMDFSGYKTGTVARRTARRLAALGLTKPEDYLRQLTTDPNEADMLAAEILIGVTRFFRESESLDVLEQKVFPSMFRDRDPDDPVRIWVAASSTGEEALTLAIMIREYLERNEWERTVKIFATDIDRRAIKTASACDFSPSVIADIPEPLIEKYFDYHGNRFVAKRAIRDMVVYAQHNLLRDPPFTRINLISCRNLMIYLLPETQKRLASIFSFALVPGGHILLGNSESFAQVEHQFRQVDEKARIYVSEPDVARPASSRFSTFDIQFASPNHRQLGQRPDATMPDKHDEDLSGMNGRIAELLLNEGMIISQNLEPVYIYGNIGKYFSLKPGRSMLDVTKLAHPDLAITLASSLARIFSKNFEENPIIRHVTLTGDNGDRRVEMILHRLDHNGKRPLALLILKEGTVFQGGEDTDVEARHTIDMLEKEVGSLKESLRETIDDSESAREELQATNEELIASNEELQSTNEELQSLNEELHTVNSELRTKIEELTDLTRDVENLMNVTGIGSLFLDEDLRIRKFSPKAAVDLNLLSADLGRSIEHFATPLHAGLVDDLKAVFRTKKPLERPVRAQDGRCHLVRIYPYKEKSSRGVDGAVVVFIDISEMVTQRSARSDLQEYAVLAGGAIYTIDRSGRVTSWSKGATQLFGYGAKEVLGKHDTILIPHDELKVAERQFSKSIEGGAELTRRTKRIRKDGTVIDVAVLMDTKQTEQVEGEHPAEADILVMCAPLA